MWMVSISALGGLDRALYTLQEIVEEPNFSRVILSCEKTIAGGEQISRTNKSKQGIYDLSRQVIGHNESLH